MNAAELTRTLADAQAFVAQQEKALTGALAREKDLENSLAAKNAQCASLDRALRDAQKRYDDMFKLADKTVVDLQDQIAAIKNRVAPTDWKEVRADAATK